ncbi:centrosome and spindle pole-associated protein 1 [Cheilinus undulatus]|uniref:centrosome and spindle pole-associated protein 1 n=1 Tax=Cheilinus undulatus TaxID=241271 RepID=UPI001BD273EE|nr:centrosome and spindle pole-associated protein 1 [Cheilinus undulatus]
MKLQPGHGLSLQLGTDYARRKMKLQQELQQDYRQHVAKKNDLKTNECHPEPQGLSLPIYDKTSVQQKLREERSKEYNLFLEKQVQKQRSRRGGPPVTTEPGHMQSSDAVHVPPPVSLPLFSNTQTNDHHPPWEHPASRRDAATLTEAVDDGKRAETWVPGHRGRRRWRVIRPKESYSSEEEMSTDREEDLGLRHRQRHSRTTPEPVYREERRIREHIDNRAPLHKTEVETPGGYDENNNNLYGKPDLQMPDRMRTAARSKPLTRQERAEFATGLMIGATEEQTASQQRKEQYKQELLKQIAEQQKNKLMEKKLELRVTATGATDPKKEFGSENPGYNRLKENISTKPGIDQEIIKKDQNPSPNEMADVDYSTGLSQLRGMPMPGSGTGVGHVPLLDYFNEDYHRDFSNMMGDVAIQRVLAGPPPAPPIVGNHYNSPYDAAYYYYGTRNPLDPYLPHYQNSASWREHHSGNFQSPPLRPPPVRPSGRNEAPDQQRMSPLNIGEVLAEKSKQASPLTYQEALRQQIKDREEQRRQEKEEKERENAKIEAYNPWGRSGGGAPIKDQNGNLVSNLTEMHRILEESYRNPVPRNSRQTQSFLMSDALSPRGKDKAPHPHQLAGRDLYREELKNQIEEKRRKQEEERERMRLQEEKEEKRLEYQRACMKREYEEDQRRQNKVENRPENHSWTHEPKTRNRREDELRQEQKIEKIEKKIPESNKDREEDRAVPSYEREPSPPVPALLKKLSDPVASRPSSVTSQLSSRTDHFVSAPSYQEVPAEAPQLQDVQQEVFRELSVLRRHLRKELRQVEHQMAQTNSENSNYTFSSRSRGQPRVAAFEMPHKQDVQPSTQSLYSGAAQVNMQNIREFNQLKYRDTASREEVRHMYPDPPTDAQSLDIQQQALIREQQRKIWLMKREEEQDFLDKELNLYDPRNKHRYLDRGDSVLPSQSTFIDVYSEDAGEEQVHQQRQLQPSADNRERMATQRRRDYDKVAESRDQRDRQSVLKLESEVRAHHHQPHVQREDTHTGDHTARSEGLSADGTDALSLRSALERRVSVDTVATEPWLRPGTSDAVKQSGCRERPNSRMDPQPWLTHRVK